MQSLSKSKLPLKLTKIFMVFVLFFSLVLQKPKETNAFPLALLLPAITNPGTVTAVLGIIGLGAAGAATSSWYNDNSQELERIATETVGKMSADMKSNLEKSFQNMLDGATTTLEISGDLITSLINNLKDSLTGTQPVLNGLYFDTTINGSLINYNIHSQPFKADAIQIYNSIDGQVYKYNSISFAMTSTNIVNLIYGTSTFGSFTITQAQRDSITTPFDLIVLNNTYNTTFKLSVNTDGSLVTPGQVLPTTELDNVGDYLTDQLLTNQNKLGLNVGINDLVNLSTNQGVPLYVNNTGQLVLRDGRPFEGDLENIVVKNRVPAVTDLAGTLTPTISGDFGMVNIKTGEIVIPNPNPPTPNPTPNIKKPDATKQPIGIQRFLPVAVVIVFILFLKAIVMYAIRLFDFLLTLPLTPSKTIDNYAFQWFMDARILGIQVYDTVLAFAMFAFSLTVYKVIRRIW